MTASQPITYRYGLLFCLNYATRCNNRTACPASALTILLPQDHSDESAEEWQDEFDSVLTDLRSGKLELMRGPGTLVYCPCRPNMKPFAPEAFQQHVEANSRYRKARQQTKRSLLYLGASQQGFAANIRLYID